MPPSGVVSVRPSVHTPPDEATAPQGGIHPFNGGKVENDALTTVYLPPHPHPQRGAFDVMATVPITGGRLEGSHLWFWRILLGHLSCWDLS